MCCPKIFCLKVYVGYILFLLCKLVNVWMWSISIPKLFSPTGHQKNDLMSFVLELLGRWNLFYVTLFSLFLTFNLRLPKIISFSTCLKIYQFQIRSFGEIDTFDKVFITVAVLINFPKTNIFRNLICCRWNLLVHDFFFTFADLTVVLFRSCRMEKLNCLN